MAGPQHHVPLQFDRLPLDRQFLRMQRFVDLLHQPGDLSRLRSPSGLPAGRVNLAALQEAVRVAGSAPSGANLQPWHFVLVTEPSRRKALLQAALQDEATPADRTLLESAPGLIAAFRVNYQMKPDGSRQKHYYVHESAGIAVSFLLAALQHGGIPYQLQPGFSAMSAILERPENETPFFLLPVGSGNSGSLAAVQRFYQRMRTRRSIRDFSSDPVPTELVQEALSAADAAPKSAGLKTWHFELVSDPDRRRQIRHLAEQEEKRFYESRITAEWKGALAPLGTAWQKPFVEVAPHLIACFRVGQQSHESAAIAAGFVIAALHQAGLSTLTYTPSPMNFLRTALGRPTGETPFLLLPVGYPADGCQVPDIGKKPLAEILTIL